MTTPDTEALRRVAKAATPGPWRCEEGSTSYPECDDRDFWAAVLSPYGREIVTLQERYSLKADDRRDYDFDAHHIATFDPPTVLALLDERDAAANRISELEARVGVLEGVLTEAESVFALVEHPRAEDRDYGPEVRALGQRIGFGALMSSASASWRIHGHTPGAEFVAGPCRVTVTRVLELIRAALTPQEKDQGL